MTSPRGFVIFLAALIASLALAIGLAIYDLAQRELDLSITQTQSQYAIYAADTGAECALYWDLKYTGNTAGSIFATSSNSVSIPTGQVFCNGQDIVGTNIVQSKWTVGPVDAADATTTFALSMGTSLSNPYVLVTVAKNGNPSRTTVTAHGYNTAASTASVVVERVLEVKY